MTTKTATISEVKPLNQNVSRLVKATTAIAWVILAIGFTMCLLNINHFSDKNVGLMVGLGFMVGSVFIYTIGTAIGLVHARRSEETPSDYSDHH